MCDCGATLQAQSVTVNAEWPVISSLIPDGSNWKATFMVEYPDVEERQAMLRQLVGVENRVYIRVGSCDPVYAIADEDLDRSDDTKTSAVHFLRFELPGAQVAALKADAVLAAGIDHENYRVEVSPVAENTRAALLADLI
ncbi:MAG: DUF3501 family protein [Proteobacteria bacterium]|nr:DUF3501 family protein [Pseudomonadota bacterium]